MRNSKNFIKFQSFKNLKYLKVSKIFKFLISDRSKNSQSFNIRIKKFSKSISLESQKIYQN